MTRTKRKVNLVFFIFIFNFSKWGSPRVFQWQKCHWQPMLSKLFKFVFMERLLSQKTSNNKIPTTRHLRENIAQKILEFTFATPLYYSNSVICFYPSRLNDIIIVALCEKEVGLTWKWHYTTSYQSYL